ncbi:MAG: MurR/RpiR family transcriptional regulator [Ruminiclostridium sp.]
MKLKENFIDKIVRNSPDLTKSQALLADYLIKNYKEAAFLSALQLGKKAGVSVATVVRLAYSLGYNGYTEMIKDVQSYFKYEMTTLEKLESYGNSPSEKSPLEENIINNLQILKELRKYIDNKSISDIVSLMDNRKLIVAGFESEASMVNYMFYYLSRVGGNVNLIDGINDNLLNIIKNSDENSLAFIFAYQRYTNNIISICRLLKENGVKIVSITDSPLSPVVKFSDQSIVIPIHDSYKTNIDVMVGIITACQAIVLEYSRRNFQKAQGNLEKLESFNKYFEIF